MLHGGVGRAVPQGAVPGGPASQGLGVPEQWLFLPGSCPSLPGTVSVAGMSGACLACCYSWGRKESDTTERLN